MSKATGAMADITKLIKEQRGLFYKDSEILDSITCYIDDYFKLQSKKKAWTLTHNPEFFKDLMSLDVYKIANKYGVSTQAVHYHKKRISNDFKTID